MAVIGFSISESKKLFFDKKLVEDAVGKAAAKVMSKGGSFVMTTARRSMRKAKMKTFGEMSPQELAEFGRVAQLRKTDKRRRKAKRPLASSKPGEPPRVRLGHLRNFLFFVFDQSTKSVVIGPAKISKSSGAPAVLEFGGTTRGSRGKTVTIAKRPYMAPALKENQSKLSALWKDSIRK